MTIVASWGGAGSNAYVDITFATSFLTTEVVDPSVWTSATSAQQSAAIKQGARDIDLYDYVGTRFFYDQTLAFPRALPTGLGSNRTQLSSTTYGIQHQLMLRDVQAANSLQAMYILQSGASMAEHQKNQLSGITKASETVGPITKSVQYGGGGVGRADTSRLSPEVLALLRPWRVGRPIRRG